MGMNNVILIDSPCSCVVHMSHYSSFLKCHKLLPGECSLDTKICYRMHTLSLVWGFMPGCLSVINKPRCINKPQCVPDRGRYTLSSHLPLLKTFNCKLCIPHVNLEYRRHAAPMSFHINQSISLIIVHVNKA